MGKPTIKIELELTKDEMMVLGYAVPNDSWGDPLKDIYEMERDFKHEIEDPYGALKSVHGKVWKAIGEAIDKTECDCPQD